MLPTNNDVLWMRYALVQARLAAERGEVPVGAVLVANQQLLAVAGNAVISQQDPSAHAEILVLRQAAKRLANYRLPATTLYVSLEPCCMCAGALVHARVERVVFAAADPRTGSAGSIMNLLQHSALNHQVAITAGVLADESADLLRRFFRERRLMGKRNKSEFQHVTPL